MSATRSSPTQARVNPYPEVTVLSYKKHKVLVKLPGAVAPDALYQYIQAEAFKRFRGIACDPSEVTLWTLEWPGFAGEEVEVTEEAFPNLERLRRLVVKGPPEDEEPLSRFNLPAAAPAVAPEGNHVFVLTMTGKRIAISCEFSDTIDNLKAKVQDKEGVPPDQQRLIYGGQALQDGFTLRQYGIKSGETIDLMLRLKGAKPVIYLYPTSATWVSAKLALVPEWEFSAIYPVVPAKRTDTGEELEWVVDAAPNGVLKEVGSGMEMSYLYWEAETTAQGLLSPPASPQLGAVDDTSFVPNRPTLDASNSVVLEVAKMTPYLDSSLKALGLHVEARTSFITYWLPSLLKHKHVALRFLPQSAYERAAPLSVEPTPDMVGRIFMLFKGIKETELGMWSDACEQSAVQWAGVVGVDSERMNDTGLFRVIEWGGMEVV